MSSKRCLTKKEISFILSHLNYPSDIPAEIKKETEDRIKSGIKNQLKKVQIYPEMIPALNEEIIKRYEKSRLSPGEAVGVIASSSLCEPATQMMLNTFHFSGVENKKVSSGIPRFGEIVDMKVPKTPYCIVPFLDDKLTMSSILVELHKFVYLNVGMLIKSYDVIPPSKKVPIWYLSNFMFYGRPDKSLVRLTNRWFLRLHLRMDLVYKFRIGMRKLVNVINCYSKEICIIASPIHIGIIDIYLIEDTYKDISEMLLTEDDVRSFVENHGVPSAEKDSMNDLFHLSDEDETTSSNLPLIGDEIDFGKTICRAYTPERFFREIIYKGILICYISGIKGITDIIPKEDNGVWICETVGSNLSEILGISGVDYTKVISNDIKQIRNILGVEAARSAMIQEFENILGENIDRRHYELLADSMVYNGDISPSTRFGIGRRDGGPLAKASFEETVKHFVNASLDNTVEIVEGVSSRITLGERIKGGTGMCKLIPSFEGYVPCTSEYANMISSFREPIVPKKDNPRNQPAKRDKSRKKGFVVPSIFT